MTQSDYYNVLGVGSDATVSEAKQAFRKLALKHHPDHGGSEAAFRELKVAFEQVVKVALAAKPFKWPEAGGGFGRYDPFTDSRYDTYEFFEPENSDIARFERSILAENCQHCQGLGVRTKATDPEKGFMSMEERFCICQRIK